MVSMLDDGLTVGVSRNSDSSILYRVRTAHGMIVHVRSSGAQRDKSAWVDVKTCKLQLTGHLHGSALMPVLAGISVPGCHPRVFQSCDYLMVLTLPDRNSRDDRSHHLSAEPNLRNREK